MLVGALGVAEGQLGEGKEFIHPPSPGRHLGMERPKRRLGIILELSGEIGPVENDLGEEAGLPGGEDVPRQLLVDCLWAPPGDADRRRAGTDRHRQGEQSDPPPGRSISALVVLRAHPALPLGHTIPPGSALFCVTANGARHRVVAT